MCFEEQKRKGNLDVGKVAGKNFANILEWAIRNMKTLKKGCCLHTIERKIHQDVA